MNHEREALVALLSYTDASKAWRRVTLDVSERGALAVLLDWAPQTLLTESVDDLIERARQQIAVWESDGRTRLLTMFDDDYPGQLREVHDLPPFIFARGHLKSWEDGVCLVGSRRASDAAIRFTREVSMVLAEESVCVVSGLAAGIDSAAHLGALERLGRTVAVIGTGIDRYYPSENRSLQERIERDGLVVSQFWPGSAPTRVSFPMRNATMSAFGSCTLVVQAGEQSGARIQARQALAHGRPLILTEWVESGTRWGFQLAESGADVTVVSTPDEALSRIGEILDRPNRLEKQLQAFIR